MKRDGRPVYFVEELYSLDYFRPKEIFITDWNACNICGHELKDESMFIIQFSYYWSSSSRGNRYVPACFANGMVPNNYKEFFALIVFLLKRK